MIQKIAVLSGLVLSASCMVVHQASFPNLHDYYYDANPNYNFAYEVNNARTGDVKSQHETRRGSAVVGQYSLIQPNGIQRTVDYSADDHSGFRAIVNNRGTQTNSRSPNIHVANLYASNVHAANVHASNVQTENVHAPNVHTSNVHVSNTHAANVHAANVQTAKVHAPYIHSSNVQAFNVQAANAHTATVQAANARNANVQAANVHVANGNSENLHAANIQAGNMQFSNILAANSYPTNGHNNVVGNPANSEELRNLRPIQVYQAWPISSGRGLGPTASAPVAVSRTSFVQTVSHGLPPRPRNGHSFWE